MFYGFDLLLPGGICTGRFSMDVRPMPVATFAPPMYLAPSDLFRQDQRGSRLFRAGTFTKYSVGEIHTRLPGHWYCYGYSRSL